MKYKYTLEEIENMTTLEQSQFDDLKYQNDNYRIWLSRMTVADGQPYNNQITVEKLVRTGITTGGKWKIIKQYEGRIL